VNLADVPIFLSIRLSRASIDSKRILHALYGRLGRAAERERAERNATDRRSPCRKFLATPPARAHTCLLSCCRTAASCCSARDADRRSVSGCSRSATRPPSGACSSSSPCTSHTHATYATTQS